MHLLDFLWSFLSCYDLIVEKSMLNINCFDENIFSTIPRLSRCVGNTLVSYHFHCVKNFLFSSAKPPDFDGMLSTGVPVSMYTTKTPIVLTLLKLKNFFFTFSVKDRYQWNYFICIKDFNAQTITSLKLNLFYFFIYRYLSASSKENDLSWYISVIRQTVRYRTPVFTQLFSWHLHITITYNLPHLRLWYVDAVTVIA